MDIELEIHVPGLDLHQDRWNYHLIFMNEVHTHSTRIAALAWEKFLAHGRGALFVDQNQWMTVIRNQWQDDSQLFPCHYVCDATKHGGVNFEVLRDGYRQMVREYEPEQQVVLIVQHHPGELLSSYLFRPTPSPPEAYRALREARQEGQDEEL